MKKRNGMRGLYKRLSEIERREANPDHAFGCDVQGELALTIIHCHVFGLDLGEIYKSGDAQKLDRYFNIL